MSKISSIIRVPVSANCHEVNAIFGSLARAFEDMELEHLLSEGLLLDGATIALLLPNITAKGNDFTFATHRIH